ncbi:hypothetical protein EVAR_68827_1 [Eumeta japonica]|uniref:Uncharacterized protein n=1 Tax=Eumeta variegata TaxID=151549 RepID=A0A4C1ZTL8_EUMVA|nr:hypothetical protein EVAR_68827_1 [Eumeta japonica]
MDGIPRRRGSVPFGRGRPGLRLGWSAVVFGTYNPSKMLGLWYGVYSWPAGRKIFGVSDKLILTNATPMQKSYLQSLCDDHSGSLSEFSEVVLANQFVDLNGVYVEIQHLLLGNATGDVMRNIIGMFGDFKYLLPIRDDKCVFENGFKVYVTRVYDVNTMLIDKIGGKKILVSRKVLSDAETRLKLIEIGLNADGGGAIVHEDERIEQLNESVYSGSLFTSDGKRDGDIERRVNLRNKLGSETDCQGRRRVASELFGSLCYHSDSTSSTDAS